MKTLILTLALFPLFYFTNAQIVNIEIITILEGPYNGIDMDTDLNDMGLLPIKQPYNIAPWNYDGMEILKASPEIDIVDWIYIELRETDGDASTATHDKFFDHQAALLLSNGAIVQPDGISPLIFSGNIKQKLFVVIYHRNHLPVMSATELVGNSGTYAYNFTDALSKAYLDGQTGLEGGMFGMIGGDSDGNGIVNLKDIDLKWENEAGNAGYNGSDLNLDSQINNSDKNSIWDKNNGLAMTVSTSCGFAVIDDRDGQYYNTILIDKQCWMAENLIIGIMVDGAIDMTDNGLIEKYCYNNLESNCEIYGGLYQWNEMMQYTTNQGVQGICPDGWYVPTYDEFQILSEKVNFNGNALKAKGQGTGSGAGTNTSGYSALLAGYLDNDGVFKYLDNYTHFWSSTENYATHSFSMFVFSDNKKIWFSNSSKDKGYSVRCMKY